MEVLPLHDFACNGVIGAPDTSVTDFVYPRACNSVCNAVRIEVVFDS
jgi:hypothetical protein